MFDSKIHVVRLSGGGHAELYEHSAYRTTLYENLLYTGPSVTLNVSGGATVLSHAAVGTLGVNHLFVFPFLELLDQFGKRCQFARID